MGSPAKQRDIHFDEQRISDLSQIQNEIINYYGQKNSLPVDLSVLDNSLTGFYTPLDPKTSTAYEYSVVDDLNFSLCATFSQASIGGSLTPGVTSISYYGAYGPVASQNWNHEGGRVCFDRKIDPDMFKDGRLLNP